MRLCLPFVRPYNVCRQAFQQLCMQCICVDVVLCAYTSVCTCTCTCVKVGLYVDLFVGRIVCVQTLFCSGSHYESSLYWEKNTKKYTFHGSTYMFQGSQTLHVEVSVFKLFPEMFCIYSLFSFMSVSCCVSLMLVLAYFLENTEISVGHCEWLDHIMETSSCQDDFIKSQRVLCLCVKSQSFHPVLQLQPPLLIAPFWI